MYLLHIIFYSLCDEFWRVEKEESPSQFHKIEVYNYYVTEFAY